MVCPNCRASVAEESNFCPKCGAALRGHAESKNQNQSSPKPDGAVKRFVRSLWRENKPGFLILSLLLVAMLGSFGYFLYSRTGRFVVTVERISRDEALDIYTKATLKVYCREFRPDCVERGENQIEKDIRLLLPEILLPPRSSDAKIIYRNRTSTPIIN